MLADSELEKFVKISFAGQILPSTTDNSGLGGQLCDAKIDTQGLPLAIVSPPLGSVAAKPNLLCSFAMLNNLSHLYNIGPSSLGR